MDLYCKIYIDTHQSRDSVLSSLVEWSGGDLRLRTVVTDFLEADVSVNKDFDDGRTHNRDNGFLFYPYYLDVEPKPDVPADLYIEALRGLLGLLRAKGMWAVAACDFEHLLSQEP
jgi:hypothetical protein